MLLSELWSGLMFRWNCWRMKVCPEHYTAKEYINDSLQCFRCRQIARDTYEANSFEKRQEAFLKRIREK